MATAEGTSRGGSLSLKSAMAGDAGVRLLLLTVGLIVILRAVLAASANLAEDETYYWLWSTHLAAGYYDHPPMIAYWIRAGPQFLARPLLACALLAF